MLLLFSLKLHIYYYHYHHHRYHEQMYVRGEGKKSFVNNLLIDTRNYVYLY